MTTPQVSTVGGGATPKNKQERLAQVAQQFEAVFVNMLMKSMRKTVDKHHEKGLGQGFQDQVFTDLFDERVSEQISKRHGGIGIAKAIVRQMEKHVDHFENLGSIEVGKKSLLEEIKA